MLRDDADPVAAVVVEAKLRVDDDEPWIWPEYVASADPSVASPPVLLSEQDPPVERNGLVVEDRPAGATP